MTLRSTHETIEDLRSMLRKFEASAGVGDDSASLDELKRILRERIAELEIAEAAVKREPE